MLDSEIEKIVRSYINSTVHLSLATVSNNRPWVCEVHFAYDESLSLYFISKHSTRHAQEIFTNSNVAGNIIKQHEKDELPAGIYFEGTATKIMASNAEVELYSQGTGRDIEMVHHWLDDKQNPSSMFRILVKNWAIFGNFDGKGMNKYQLGWSE